MKGRFVHESGVETVIESQTKDLHLLPELIARQTFIEEATRRLGAVIEGNWMLVEIVREARP